MGCLETYLQRPVVRLLDGRRFVVFTKSPCDYEPLVKRFVSRHTTSIRFDLLTDQRSTQPVVTVVSLVEIFRDTRIYLSENPNLGRRFPIFYDDVY